MDYDEVVCTHEQVLHEPEPIGGHLEAVCLCMCSNASRGNLRHKQQCT